MSRRPRWARLLVGWLAPDEADDVLGDLQEAHVRRLRDHGPFAARALTAAETLEMAAALLRMRVGRFHAIQGNSTMHDYRLGLRMLVKYPGLTLAGGLALAISIGLGAGWYDLSRDLFRPRLPLPDGNRIVEVEMRDSSAGADERRIMHDFEAWRRQARLLEDLGAYRTLERNLILGDAPPEPVTVAETTASAFAAARVSPLLGRPLLDSDEAPGAPPVVVLGYGVWQRQFGGSAHVIGATLQLGRSTAMVVGVMPEGFAFPVNHRLWVPLRTPSPGYGPLEGPGVRVFGRVAAGATQAQAYAELVTINERTAATSPQTHRHLRPRILAYGGESPGDRAFLEGLVTHLPVVLVLLVACVNVGTLIYARTATREAEIATRHALGASRGRIVSQLFVEALVLAAIAAVVGLAGANLALEWGVTAYFSGQSGGMPFWMNPGIKPWTVAYAAVLTLLGAALLGVLPALKATGRNVQLQLRHAGAGGSTLRFGKVWAGAMIGQVALTVIMLPAAMGISHEAWRDRQIREQYPAERYLAVRVSLDREPAATPSGEESAPAFAARLTRTYRELERRILQEPDVVALTFADRLPGMGPAVRRAEIDRTGGSGHAVIPNLWTTSVGPRFFETFDVRVLAGRDFHDGDRAAGARTALVNQAFARHYLDGASPVGHRVRFAGGDAGKPEPWFEIVGMVSDIGMTPTDFGEAPYLFRAAAPAGTFPLVMGVRVAGDPAAVAPRVRRIAADLDPSLRLDDVGSLDDLAWRVDVPALVAAGAIAVVVALGLFLSAAGIFSLMSVNIARRTREIGLRAALGAGRGRLLAGVFFKAFVLIGSGVATGNLVLLLFVALSEEVTLPVVIDALIVTSATMIVVGMLACAEPARRALRIEPMEALREA